MKNSFLNFIKLYWFWLVPLLPFLSLSFYLFTSMQAHHFHESAYSLYYAKNVLEHGLYSTTFNGREVSPFTWAVPTAFLLKIFGFNLFTHSFSSFTFLCFAVLSTIFFIKKFKIKVYEALFLLTLIFLIFTEIPTRYRWLDQVWMWPMNSYGFMDFLSIPISFLFFKYADISNQSEIKFKVTYLVLFLLIFVSSLMGIRGVFVICLPLLLSLAFFVSTTISKFSIYVKQQYTYLFILILAALILGLLSNLYIGYGSAQDIQNSHLVFSGGSPIDKLNSFIFSWFNLFEAIPSKGIKIFSIRGLRYISSFIFCIFIFWIPLLFRSRLNSLSNIEQLFVYKHYALMFVILFAFVIGAGDGFERYLISLAYSSFFCSIIIFNKLAKKRNLLFFCIVLLIPVYIYSISKPFRLFSLDENHYTNSNKYKLAKFLLNHGFTKGYFASYENDLLTLGLYSSGQINVGIVEPYGNLKPHWHGDSSWYKPVLNLNKSFFIVKSGFLNSHPYEDLVIRNYSVNKFQFEDLEIYEFPYDLSVHFNDSFDKTSCLESFSNRVLFYKLLLPASGNNNSISCKGWNAGFTTLNNKPLKELHSEAKVYLKADKTKLKFRISGLSKIAGTKLFIKINNQKIKFVSLSNEINFYDLQIESNNQLMNVITLTPESNNILIHSVEVRE
jgi:hypothetical protein